MFKLRKRRPSLDDATARVIAGTGETLGIMKDGYHPLCQHNGAHPYWRCPNWDALAEANRGSRAY